jgi:hypothetical protein
MARTRNLKPGFFKNEELAECSPFARLLFAGLWTLADRDGRLEYRPKRIKAELFPFDAVEVPELVAELHGKKLLEQYKVGELEILAIPTFKKHQRPHPKEPKSLLPQPPCETKTCDKAAKINGEPCKETASCALPSSNPLILSSSYPNSLNQSAELEELSEAWKAAAAAMRKSGVDYPEEACFAARARGCTPFEVEKILEKFDSKPGAWTPRWLFSTVKNLCPEKRIDWPPLSVEYTRKLESLKRARAVAEQQEKREKKKTMSDEEVARARAGLAEFLKTTQEGSL